MRIARDAMDFFKLGGRNSTGWRQAAEVNSTILMATSLLFMMCLVTIVVKTGDFARVWFFYGGNCETAHVSEVNKALHLFLNLFSTAMVSSTPQVFSGRRGCAFDSLLMDRNRKIGEVLPANLQECSEFVQVASIIRRNDRLLYCEDAEMWRYEALPPLEASSAD